MTLLQFRWLFTFTCICLLLGFEKSNNTVALASGVGTGVSSASSSTSKARAGGANGKGSSGREDDDEDDEEDTEDDYEDEDWDDDDDDDDGRYGRGRGNDSAGDKWKNLMRKFNIPKVHGSGVYVDLGDYATVKGVWYRMPAGRCPVVGKSIKLDSGGYFLNPINAKTSRERGLAFPRTSLTQTAVASSQKSKVRGTRRGEPTQTLSPISSSTMNRLGYDNDSNVANCAEHARNVAPGSDSSSTYRYPWVYDADKDKCYLLFSGMQYNQGTRYCDSDNNPKRGKSSLVCMYPTKNASDNRIYYGSSKVYPDFENKCPMNPVKDAVYGRWSGDACIAMRSAHEEQVSSLEECAQLLFDASPSDVTQKDLDKDKEVSKFVEGLLRFDFNKITAAVFQPISPTNRNVAHSSGVGVNWANYDSNTGVCKLLKAVPNCMIINAGSYALNSIGSAAKSDAEPYPCNMDTKGYLVGGPQNESKAVTTALSLDALQCKMYKHKRHSESCGYYYECSSEPGFLNKYKWLLIALAVFILLIGVFWVWKHLSSSKLKKEITSAFDRMLSKYDYNTADDGDHGNVEGKEQHMGSDAYMWAEHEGRASQVTPVHLEKLE